MSQDDHCEPDTADHTRRDAFPFARIPVALRVVLGSATMTVRQLGELEHGAVVRLDRRIGEPVEIEVNGQRIGRGQIMVTEGDDARFAISMTELIDQPEPES